MVCLGAQHVDRWLCSGQNVKGHPRVEAERRRFREALENGESVRRRTCFACGVSCRPLASWGSYCCGTAYTAALRELSLSTVFDD